MTFKGFLRHYKFICLWDTLCFLFFLTLKTPLCRREYFNLKKRGTQHKTTIASRSACIICVCENMTLSKIICQPLIHSLFFRLTSFLSVLPACMYTTWKPGAHGDQKRVLALLEMEFQMVVTTPWGLGTKPRYSARASFLNCPPSLQPSFPLIMEGKELSDPF